jgi:sRNA-binding protein
VEPVAVTAARVNAQADQAKAEFVAKVAEQQTDLTPAEKQEMKGAMERDPDPVAPAPAVDGEAPATPTERQTFLNRAAKIVRDTMEGKAKVKEAGPLMKAYLIKQSGLPDLKKITAAKWEQMISELEGIADPVAVAEKVKAGR